MAEAITFGNVEAATVQWLASVVGVPVHRVLPDDLDDEFVRVMLTGSRRRNLVTEDAQVTLECWARSDAAAEALARTTYGWMCAMDQPDGTHVPQGEDGWVGGPYAQPDPVTSRPRYVMTAVVRHSAITL